MPRLPTQPSLSSEQLAECYEAERQLHAQARWNAANAPKRHADFTNFREPAWVAKQDELIDQIGKGFLVALLGPCGTGKTQLAVEVLREAAEQNRNARYEKVMLWFMDLKATYGRDGNGRLERDVFEEYIAYDLLVLDEVGERGETLWEDRMLGLLLDKRYDDGRDTILISNHEPSAFYASVGPRVKDRLIETGGVVTCDWPSFRVKAERAT